MYIGKDSHICSIFVIVVIQLDFVLVKATQFFKNVSFEIMYSGICFASCQDGKQ